MNVHTVGCGRVMARAISAGIALMCLLPSPAAAQTAPPAAAWQPARTPDGQPDIQGFWDTPDYAESVETGLRNPSSARIQGQPVGIPAVVAAGGKPVSAIIDPPDGQIPYQPWAAARRREIANRYGGTDTPRTVRDVTPELVCTIGLPRIVYFVEFQVIQSPGSVVMSWERTHAYRVIPLDGRPHVASNVKLHMGDARGRWEGNTLVVNTTNLKDWSWFDATGTFHSEAMSLVERFTPIDASTLRYEVRVEDPETFTRPWTMAFIFKRQHAQDPGYEPMEWACAEGERALEAILGKR